MSALAATFLVFFPQKAFSETTTVEVPDVELSIENLVTEDTLIDNNGKTTISGTIHKDGITWNDPVTEKKELSLISGYVRDSQMANLIENAKGTIDVIDLEVTNCIATVSRTSTSSEKTPYIYGFFRGSFQKR